MASVADKTGTTLVAMGAPVEGRRARRRSSWGYLFMPLLITAALVGLYLIGQNRTYSTGERRRLNAANIRTDTWEHVELTVVSTVLVLLIAIPLGVLLTRTFATLITPPILAVFNIGQATPSIGVIALLAIVYSIGFKAAVIALVIYTVIPVLRNTMVGLRQVDENVIEAARGMGMTKLAVLLRIELPLAVPIIMAGLRTALTINVGTATLAAFIGAGGLGELIIAGFVQNKQFITVVGGVLVACLALLIDYLAAIAEEQLRPRGI
jgi:osmoprotectant transport system permease protein